MNAILNFYPLQQNSMAKSEFYSLTGQFLENGFFSSTKGMDKSSKSVWNDWITGKINDDFTELEGFGNGQIQYIVPVPKKKRGPTVFWRFIQSLQ